MQFDYALHPALPFGVGVEEHKISTDPSKIENNEIGNQVEEHHVEWSRSNQVDGEVSRRNRKVILKPFVAN